MNRLISDIKNAGKLFDHALLKAAATSAEFENLCREGIQHNVKILAVNPAAVSFCVERVRGSGVDVGAAVSFPLGQSTTDVKLFETRDSIAKGAREIDYVIDISALKNKDYGFVTNEMQSIVNICREKGVVSKVIFENCELTDDEKKRLCEIANTVRPDFIKTSTGFGVGGATVDDVRLMRAYADPGIKIKASGGIKTWADVAELYEAGAIRIGTSHTVSILEEYMRIAQ